MKMTKKEHTVAIILMVATIILGCYMVKYYTDKTVEAKIELVKTRDLPYIVSRIKTRTDLHYFNRHALGVIRDNVERKEKKLVNGLCEYAIEINEEFADNDLLSEDAQRSIVTLLTIKGNMKNLRKKDYQISVDFIEDVIEIKTKMIKLLEDYEERKKPNSEKMVV